MEKKKAHEQLSNLYNVVKAEGNCTEYVDEMCAQLRLFGTELNGLTRQMIYDKLKEVISIIKKTL